jgi:SpoVK/Ycf46/Vps4 family AAA+-type ATPase
MNIKLLILTLLFSTFNIFSTNPLDNSNNKIEWTEKEKSLVLQYQNDGLSNEDKKIILDIIKNNPWLTLEQATTQHQQYKLQKKSIDELLKAAEPLKFIALAIFIQNVYSLCKPFIEPYIQKHIAKFIFKNTIQTEQNNINFNNIAGYTGIKKELKPVINKIKKQKKSGVLEKMDGILFYGAPGCGKTLFAESIANEAGIGFFNIKASDLINEDGNIGDRIKLLFEKIYAYTQNTGPCVLFVDEIDLLAPNRGMGKLDNNEKIVLQDLLCLLDGSKSLKGVLIIANTNFINAIDVALLRHGRLGTHIEFKLPTINDIEQICLLEIKKLKLELDMNYNITEFAKKFLGKNVAHIIQSISDIKDFILENKYPRVINHAILNQYENEHAL